MNDFSNDPEYIKRYKIIESLMSLARTNPACPKDSGQFNAFFAQWMGIKPESWRHIRNARRPISDRLLKRIEQRHQMAAGTLLKNPEVFGFNEHLFQAMRFVRDYLIQNKISHLSAIEESDLVKNIYEESLDTELPFNEASLKRYLKLLK
ncbi:hypothetical protein MNBD_GAMMA02-1623 [hydrothermal vent metagenome]|uniref:Uncharacterized protein n=1 Tax=hydrothermal vent metagenome TaxID=652676 RepID=A0A3B0WR09_9ZZZZ